ncbi:hypothetical protein D3C81_1544790 [compost metagenome]
MLGQHLQEDIVQRVFQEHPVLLGITGHPLAVMVHGNRQNLQPAGLPIREILAPFDQNLLGPQGFPQHILQEFGAQLRQALLGQHRFFAEIPQQLADHRLQGMEIPLGYRLLERAQKLVDPLERPERRVIVVVHSRAAHQDVDQGQQQHHVPGHTHILQQLLHGHQ